jgi:hypothetical protein
LVLEVGGVWNEHHMRSRAIASRGDVGVCGWFSKHCLLCWLSPMLCRC